MILNFDYLCDLVKPVAKNFHDAGQTLYLVGGVVRNAFLNTEIENPDLDLTTSATPEEIRLLVEPLADAVWLQGERFGTIGLRIGNLVMEITTHRHEAYLSNSGKPVVTCSQNIEDDLSRRDFTINSMAVDVITGKFYDPFNGQGDLEKKILRTPLSPEDSFNDDPLRMLRAARFIAGYDLEPNVKLKETAKYLSKRLGIVSAERIRIELFKLLSLENPVIGLEFLNETGILKQILPSLNLSAHSDLIQTFDRLESDDPLLRLVILLKGTTMSELESSQKFLKMSREETKKLKTLIEIINKISAGPIDSNWSEEDIRRLIATTGKHYENVVSLVNSLKIDKTEFLSLFDKLSESGKVTFFEPALTANEIMDLLSLEPGPAVGEILDWLYEISLSKGKIEKDAAKSQVVLFWEKKKSS